MQIRALASVLFVLIPRAPAAAQLASSAPVLPRSAAGPAPQSALAPPPPNDVCSTPTVLVGAGPHPFDTTSATASPSSPGPCSGGSSTTFDHDLWFCWTAPTSGAIELSSVGQTFVDTKIEVFAGCGCPTGAPIACNDDTCGTLQSAFAFFVNAGNVYTIRIGTKPGVPGGTGTFTIQPPAPATPPCLRDDGSSENSVGLNAAGKFAWMARYGAVGTTTNVSQVRVAYGSPSFPGHTPPLGTIVDVLVWDDPNDDGLPHDAVLLALVASTITSPDTDVLVAVPVVPAVVVEGIYFVGVGVPLAPGMRVAALDQSTLPCSGIDPSWMVGDTTGLLDYATLTNNNVPPTSASSAGFPGTWLLRANCVTLGVSECPGDGLFPLPAALPCPCANYGALRHGCASSFNPQGALLLARGSATRERPGRRSATACSALRAR
jgi:hypothetical protein